MSALISIPGLSGIWKIVAGPVKSWIRSGFTAVVDYVWQPLRPWFEGAVGWLGNALNAVEQTALLAGVMSGKLLTVLNNAPDFIARWLIKGFLLWIEEVGQLLEDFIEKHWDD